MIGKYRGANSLALPGYERQNSIQRSIIKDIKFGDLLNFNPHIHVLAAESLAEKMLAWRHTGSAAPGRRCAKAAFRAGSLG